MSTVHLIYGPQGAGKSTYAMALCEREEAIHFSIDRWMAHLFGPDLPQHDPMPWIMTRVERCESLIWDTAQAVAKRSVPVVLDLGFMKAADRTRFAAAGEDAGLLVQRHYVHAERAVRRERVQARNLQRGATFAFVVTPGMFDAMDPLFEAPSPEERACSRVHGT